MSRWDELERAVKDCKRMVAHYGVSNFVDHVNPDVVLTLIKQNRRMRQALLELRNHSSVTAHQIEAIDAAIGEDQ